MNKKKLIVAIDGPAGSGKSTTARRLAKRLGLPYIDTGAMYRALTLKVTRESIPFDDVPALVRSVKKAHIRLAGDPEKQKVFLNGKDVTRPIREPELTNNVVYIAREPRIRHEMVKKQRAMGRQRGAVMEGRDIGTVVFPRADFKFYFEADSKLRARRRRRELLVAGKRPSFARVYAEILERDRADRTRKQGPLRRAKDARLMDTTLLTIDQTVDKILRIIEPEAR